MSEAPGVVPTARNRSETPLPALQVKVAEVPSVEPAAGVRSADCRADAPRVALSPESAITWIRSAENPAARSACAACTGLVASWAQERGRAALLARTSVASPVGITKAAALASTMKERCWLDSFRLPEEVTRHE